MEFCSRDRRYVTSQGFPFFTNDGFYKYSHTLMHLLVGGGGGGRGAGSGKEKGRTWEFYESRDPERNAKC